MSDPAALTPLDWRAIAGGLLRPVLSWSALVALLSLFGFPGVVCLTAVAWGLALIVGRDVVLRTRTPDSRGRVREATIAGALLGAYLGLVFVLVTALLFPVQPEEISRAVAVDLVAFFGGLFVCAGLAYLYTSVFLARVRPD